MRRAIFAIHPPKRNMKKWHVLFSIINDIRIIPSAKQRDPGWTKWNMNFDWIYIGFRMVSNVLECISFLLLVLCQVTQQHDVHDAQTTKHDVVYAFNKCAFRFY